jgi:hypothetical protein
VVELDRIELPVRPAIHNDVAESTRLLRSSLLRETTEIRCCGTLCDDCDENKLGSLITTTRFSEVPGSASGTA